MWSHCATASVSRGMRVLQFAFDGRGDNPHLPSNTHNTVVYTGTHDNPTTRAWFEALPDQLRQNMWNYLKRHTGLSGDVAPALIELAWGSAAGLARSRHCRICSTLATMRG